MDWQHQLIAIYLYICKAYEEDLWRCVQRFAPHAPLNLSDEEVISLYLFGILDGHRTIQQIYTYADRHLRGWFPGLPSYPAYVMRLNRLADLFAPLLERIQSESATSDAPLLVDSFPVALARQGHRFKACVAPELADHGYCATKKLYFYGVRVHVIGRKQAGTLPTPEYIGMLPASEHDGKAFDLIRPVLKQEAVFGDKAYQRPDAAAVEQQQQLNVFTPVKKKKGQAYLDTADKWLSTAVSQVRQPIETLFGWIEKKTGIEVASNVRSYQGLLVHVFGRLAAAMFFWNHLGSVDVSPEP
jgi:hypothetical protein